jgi:deoxyribonuclease-4
MLDGYRGTTRFCIEISAGAGAVLGARFEEVGWILGRLGRARRALRTSVGVCFDTCHAFASGYDLRTPGAVDVTLAEFDRHVGLERLWLVHANDSKMELGGKRDRHEHIGKGHIGRAGFAALVAHPRLQGLGFYLELPPESVKPDLALLKRLRAAASRA